MSFIEVEHDDQIGWFCNDDLILVCEREILMDNPFMNDDQLQSMHGIRRRYVPKVDFNDKKLFPSFSIRKNQDDELHSELDSMLSCREYVSKQNHFFERKLFQQAQAAQADEEKKLEEYKKRREEQRKRQHLLHITRFDEKRYIPHVRKRPSRFDH
ncbi:unnamed protein product [Adineta ricciae]|uniref:Uncharacterized protein n=1 Tax=Adineta ricciae TaxID=249248 RepID=A0A815WW81_ADIRI|nr:unnamed protein product [Adineta ricciae]